MGAQGGGLPCCHALETCSYEPQPCTSVIVFHGHIPVAKCTSTASTPEMKKWMRRHHITHRKRCRTATGSKRPRWPGMTVPDSQQIPSMLQEGQSAACLGMSPAPKGKMGQARH